MNNMYAGFIRGSYVGALWGLLFHRYDVKPLPEDASRARVLAHTFRIRAGESVINRPESIDGSRPDDYHIGLYFLMFNINDLNANQLNLCSGRVPALVSPGELFGALQRLLLRGREDDWAAQLVRNRGGQHTHTLSLDAMHVGNTQKK